LDRAVPASESGLPWAVGRHSSGQALPADEADQGLAMTHWMTKLAPDASAPAWSKTSTPSEKARVTVVTGL